MILVLPNTSAEVTLQPTPALTWVSTGGVLDLYTFLGPDPQSVIRQYLQVIGMSCQWHNINRHLAFTYQKRNVYLKEP